MANYQKTQELFEKEQNRTPNLKYKKSPAQLKEENWLASVTKSDGTFIQLDLKAVGAVPTDFKSGPGEKPKKYPDKKVYCLFRIKKSDGSEWLVSRQKWVGLDRLGNETMKIFLDPETYDKPNFSYQNVRIVDNKNKTNIVNDPFPKFERKAATRICVKTGI